MDLLDVDGVAPESHPPMRFIMAVQIAPPLTIWDLALYNI